MSKVAIETGSPGIPTILGDGGGWVSGELFFERDPGKSHMKGAGMLVGNFELNPGVQYGPGPTLFCLLKENILNFDSMNRLNKTN